MNHPVSAAGFCYSTTWQSCMRLRWDRNARTSSMDAPQLRTTVRSGQSISTVAKSVFLSQITRRFRGLNMSSYPLQHPIGCKSGMEPDIAEHLLPRQNNVGGHRLQKVSNALQLLRRHIRPTLFQTHGAILHDPKFGRRGRLPTACHMHVHRLSTLIGPKIDQKTLNSIQPRHQSHRLRRRSA